MGKKKQGCELCEVFQGEGCEISNKPEEPGEDNFPPAWGSLEFVKNKEGAWDDETWYRCPSCGAMYVYTRTTPGGSYDAMQTWIVERCFPLMKNGIHLHQNPEKKIEPPVPEADSGYRCPDCHSGDVIQTGFGTIGGEAFMELHCQNCGKEEFLDEYRLEFWMR